MKATKTLAWTVVLVMTGAILYGLASGGFGADASAIWRLPWGKVSLIDLYAGLAMFGAWIALRETNRFKIALWWAALATLGNFAAGVYLVGALLAANDTGELLTGESLPKAP